jgi:PAS domain S-box-containing protein
MTRSIYRLRILIPAMIFSATLLLVFFLTFEKMRDGEKEIIRSFTETAQYQMNQLQDILTDTLVKGDLEQAKQRLSYAALSPHIATLILTNANHTVFIANRQELVDTNAATQTHYDKGLAEKTISLQQGNIIASDHHHVHGYFPVTLGVQAGEIRPLQSGTLYVEYDFTDHLNILRSEAYNSAAKLCAALFVFALAISFLLQFLITRPIDRLVSVVKEFANGNLKARINVSKMNELGQLGLAFNEMATELEHNQECLQEQNIQLEEEVTEREAAQEELQIQATQLEEEIAERRLAEEKLQIIFDAAQAGIIMINASGVITFANPCVSRLYGFEPSEIVGSRYIDHVHQDDRKASENLFQKQMRGDFESISAERHYLCKDGSDFWGLLNAMRHLDDNGRLISVIIVIIDISELKKGEQERELLQRKFNQSQKMEAIGRLAGGIAHDFNNKLTVIMGYAELLKMKGAKLGRDEIDHLDEIIRAADHSREITRQLLSFSRSEVISPHKANINCIIEESRKSLGRLIGEDIRLEFRPGANLWPTLLDPTQVDQIIMNLAVNARDAMPDGGLLEIETLNMHIDESYCHKFPDSHPGDYVQISFSDTGCGMDNDTLEHIFEPFFTTKEVGKGTGLGLATIYGIVSQNGGFLHAYSEKGVGTTFKIYFPKMTLENGTSATRHEEAEAISGIGTILLVEDEESLRKLASEMMSEMGYTVLEAKLPMDAIEICLTDDTKKIDLILTDVIMPGMNGKEMSDRISKIRPDVPVLFMSGYSADIIAEKGILEGAVHFIQKPFTLQKLSLKIQETIESIHQHD